MAKMTMGQVTYEGTPEELREIVRSFEETEDIRPVEVEAEILTFEGAEYALVSRKARTGDVVVFTGGGNMFFTKGETYGPAIDQGRLCVKDDDGDHLHVYSSGNGRTESNVLVYEKVAKESTLKVGDEVEVIVGSKSRYGDLGTGTVGEITDIGVVFKEMYRVDTEDDYDRFPAEALRKVTEEPEVIEYPENGDIVRATKDYHEIKVGMMGVVTYADGSNTPKSSFGEEISWYAPVELVARAEDRVDTK